MLIDRKVIFKNFAPFTDCISKIINKQRDNAEDIDVVMLMYNLIGYSDNYSKVFGSSRQYSTNKAAKNSNGIIVAFDEVNIKLTIAAQKILK